MKSIINELYNGEIFSVETETLKDEKYRRTVNRVGQEIEELIKIFCKNPQNLVKQRITPHFLTADYPNYYEFTTKG